jgi:hypothetical protein
LTWVKHDDGFSQNRKVAKLTDKAYRLHFCALEHCARNLTDGTIMDYELSNVFAVAQIKRNGLGYVAELVDACLWKTIIHGYEIHEYLEHNPSAADVKEVRKRNAERQKKHREGKRHGVTNTVTESERNGVTNGVSHAAPSRPIPYKEKPSIRLVGEKREEILAEFETKAEKVGLTKKQKARGRMLGPDKIAEVMLDVFSRGDVDNVAAYFVTAIENKHAEGRPYKSEVPLEERLLEYVRNEGFEYSNELVTADLRERGATDESMIARLLVKADEIRNEEAA